MLKRETSLSQRLKQRIEQLFVTLDGGDIQDILITLENGWYGIVPALWQYKVFLILILNCGRKPLFSILSL